MRKSCCILSSTSAARSRALKRPAGHQNGPAGTKKNPKALFWETFLGYTGEKPNVSVALRRPSRTWIATRNYSLQVEIESNSIALLHSDGRRGKISKIFLSKRES